MGDGQLPKNVPAQINKKQQTFKQSETLEIIYGTSQRAFAQLELEKNFADELPNTTSLIVYFLSTSLVCSYPESVARDTRQTSSY